MNYLEFVKVSLSAADHLDVPGSPETLTETLSTLQREDVVQTAAKILYYLERASGPGVVKAQHALTHIFPDEIQQRLERGLQAPNKEGGFDAIFYPQQLLTLQRIALAASPPGPPTSFDEGADIGKFLVAAAQVTDVIASTSRFPSSGPSGIPSDQLAAFTLRNAIANRIVFFKAVAGRSYRIWLDSHVDWPEGITSPDEYCEAHYGIGLLRWVAIAAVPALVRSNVGPSTKPEDAVFDPETYFKDTNVPKHQAETVLRDITFAPEAPTIPFEQSTYWDLTPLAERPYLPVGQGLLMPCSAGRAFERATTGIFWLLHRELRLRAGTPEALTTHFGTMFEDYCFRLMESVGTPSRQVSGEIEYGTRKHPRLTSDILICEVPAARVFIEVTALRPPVSLLTDPEASTVRSFVGRLVRKLKQLDRTVEDHRRGAFRIGGDTLPTDAPYLPVLVVDEPLAWSPPLRSLVDSATRRMGLFGSSGVAAPVICDVGEFEHLVYLVEQGQRLGRLLPDYLITTQRDVPLEQYLHNQEPLDSPSFVRSGFSAIAEALASELGFNTPPGT